MSNLQNRLDSVKVEPTKESAKPAPAEKTWDEIQNAAQNTVFEIITVPYPDGQDLFHERIVKMDYGFVVGTCNKYPGNIGKTCDFGYNPAYRFKEVP